jgi:hypothetical protein
MVDASQSTFLLSECIGRLCLLAFSMELGYEIKKRKMIQGRVNHNWA